MRQKRPWLSLGIIFSVLFNALPLHSQVKTAEGPQTFELNLTPNSKPNEIYRNFLQTSREGVFSPLIKIVSGRSSTDSLENSLENNAVDFFEAIYAASQESVAKFSEKSQKISQKNYEELRRQIQQTEQPRVRKTAQRGGPNFDDLADDEVFDFGPRRTENIFERVFSLSDRPEITKTETESGVEFKGNQSKRTELAEASVTQTTNSGTKLNFDGKTTTDEFRNTEKTEITSNIDNKKVTETSDFNYKTSFDMCPDARGHVSGKSIANISKQTLVNTGKDLFALTTEWKVEIKATAYVDDNAEMTHFDMIIDVVEKNTGYDRAKRLDLEGFDTKLNDGSKQITFQMMNNSPPSESVDVYGRKTYIPIKYGNMEAMKGQPLSDEEAKRIGRIAGVGIGFAILKFDMLMRNSISEWQSYSCVDVECTAAKNMLSPGESIDVNAVSISKLDLSKFNAKLKGYGSEAVTPTDQFGAPKAVYNLTAMADGTAVITVRSTSRRGIGLGMLEFGRNSQDDEEICNGNWQGTIEIRKSFEESFKKNTKPGEISSNLRMSGTQESVNRKRYEGTVKIVSPKVVTAGVSLMDAKFDASAERFFLNQGNTTEPGECGWNKPTITKVEGGTELKETFAGKGTTDITIQVSGNIYRVSTSLPRINGTYSRRTWHKPSGYCQPGNNIPSDKTENDTAYFDPVGISFEGTIDPKQPDVLNGTKTLTSDDGKETTIITWRLKRCVPAKTKGRVKK